MFINDKVKLIIGVHYTEIKSIETTSITLINCLYNLKKSPFRKKSNTRIQKKEIQYNESSEEKDQFLLNKIERFASPFYFSNVKRELEDTVNPHNYRIVLASSGKMYNEYHRNIWIVRTDSYTGTVSMNITNKLYLMWNYGLK
ncbi:MAG: hypothetical protein KAS32_28440 [Candidatus Peribacteraceae bacterium]|nr:hypothetical protein [Candidatus Peribacteraceae bacterium]